MNPEHHDKVFVATFLAVVGFLGAFTLAIIVIANVVSAQDEPDPALLARLEERIQPVGRVVTDEKMLLALAPPPAAKREPMSGPEVVANVCNACHGTGILGAPKTGDKAAFATRGNLAALVAGAIKGRNQMPARGGDPSLSDAEIKAAVQEMIR